MLLVNILLRSRRFKTLVRCGSARMDPLKLLRLQEFEDFLVTASKLKFCISRCSKALEFYLGASLDIITRQSATYDASTGNQWRPNEKLLELQRRKLRVERRETFRVDNGTRDKRHGRRSLLLRARMKRF